MSDTSTAAGRIGILITCGERQPTLDALEREAAAGVRPRKDYVELTKLLGADVIDAEYMHRRATVAARLVRRVAGMAAGQVTEAFLRRRRYGTIVAWADKLGLPLALLFRLVRSPRRLVLVSVLVTDRKKAPFFERLHVDSNIRAVIGRSLQMKMIVEDFGVPRVKTHAVAVGVDELFWRPLAVEAGNLICAVGGEERDYPTLFRAVEGLEVDVEVAAGTVMWIDSAEIGDQVVVPKGQLTNAAVPANVRVASRKQDGLRDLYARSRFVVVPLREVKFDAGGTALTEAMAMGKAVIATRTPGIADLFDDGEAGLFVPPGDAAALRAAIQRLLDDPAEAERMGRAGRARIERAHRLDAEMRRYADIVLAAGA